MKRNFSVNHVTVGADIPKALRFAFAADLHNRVLPSESDAVTKSGADALLVAGDLISEEDEYENGLAFLSACAQSLPTFMAIGNHDRRFRGDLAAAVEGTGAVLLDNRALPFMGITLGGLSSGFLRWSETKTESKIKDHVPNLSFLDEFSKGEGYKLLLCHHPEYYEPYIRPLSIDLTLAGHAHGGQWRFFGRGVYAPGQGLFPRYTAGLYEERLLVSRGMANASKGIPRLNNRPELLVLDLVPQEGAAE